MKTTLKGQTVEYGGQKYTFHTINDARRHFLSWCERTAGSPVKRPYVLGDDFTVITYAKHMIRFSDPVTAELVEE